MFSASAKAQHGRHRPAWVSGGVDREGPGYLANVRHRQTRLGEPPRIGLSGGSFWRESHGA